jgi:hypothetical protein
MSHSFKIVAVCIQPYWKTVPLHHTVFSGKLAIPLQISKFWLLMLSGKILTSSVSDFGINPEICDYGIWFNMYGKRLCDGY